MFAPTYRSRTIAGLLSLTGLVISLTCFVDFGVHSAGRSGDVELLTNSLSGTDVVSRTSLIVNDIVSRTSLIVNDIVYNPQDHKLYASRPGSAGPQGNSISGIDIFSGQVTSNVFIGSEPNRLALSSDGSVLHVGLDGCFGIRRYYTVTQEAGPQFSLGAQNNVNPYTAGDIAVTPGNANVIAVNRASYSSGGDIALFNEFGIKLPLVISDSNPVPGTLAFSASPSVLYAAGLRTINVTDQGLVQSGDSTSFGVPRVKFDNGLIFSSIGQVVNPQTRTLLGTFPGAGTNAFAPDTSVGRAYYAVRDTSSGSIVLKAFDVNTYVLIGSLTIPNVTSEPTTLVRYGTNGLALRTADGKLFLIQTSLIPTGDPLPTPTATPTVTPTPISSPYTVFMRRIGIPANDLVYLNSTQKILASIASSDNTRGNSVTQIDPLTGAIENSTFVGSEPGAMALTEDQQTLYVGLDGAGSVRKFDVPGRVAGEQFYLGTSSYGPLKAYRIAVRPGSSETVAVSTNSGFDSPRIYDSGVMRPQIGNGSGPMTFSSADQIYISNTSNVLTRYTVWPTGAIMPQTVPAAASGNMVYAEGKIYFGNGRVVDAATNAVVGSFAGLGYYYTVAVDTASRRVFFFTNYQSGSGWRIVAYDMDTYRPIGTIPIQIFFMNQLKVFIRWGTNGLAFRDDFGNIYLIQSDLVGPGPVPTPTPTITPTPTPSPTNAPTFIRQVNLPANDVAYSESAQSLLVSVPGSAGPERGNTITRVDPASGVVGLSAFVGSEPSKLALSDDGQTLYTKLDGAAGAIRRFDVAAGTPGLQFAGPPYWADMKVMPGSPQTLAIASGNNGSVAIFDNGVQRPATSNGGAYGIYSIDFADAATLYGYDSYSSGYELVKFDVTANGVTGTNIGNALISGGGRIAYSGGRLYSQYGRVVDPRTRTSVGTFDGGGDAMAVDPVTGRVFFIYNNVLTAFDSSTFRKIGSTALPGVTGTATSLVRWGENGLALRTTSGNSSDGRLYIIQSRLVSDTAVVPIGLQLSSPNYSVPEFISTLAVSITRTGDTTRPVSVKYSTSDGTATAGSDYTAVHGELAFAAGETTKSVSIPIVNDNVYEGPETFNFSLIDENQPGVNIVYPQTASIVISDNDNQPSISSTGLSVAEPRNGAVNTADFVVRLSNPSVQSVSVNFSTSDGTARAGSDYAAASGTLTFAPLETVKTVKVQILGDRDASEPTENFFLNFGGAQNGTVSTAQVSCSIVNNPTGGIATVADFDNDGKTDLSVFRPDGSTGGEWWGIRSSDNGVFSASFGTSSDRAVPADFTGDGKTDIAFFRPENGFWYVLRSEDSSFYGFPFGAMGDIPAPADFDGDGKADPTVFRPSLGAWFTLRSSDGGVTSAQFGASGDRPIVADYDGDRKADIAIYRPNGASGGEWWISKSTGGVFAATFGTAADKPAPGDWTGDGKADCAFFRPSDHSWYILRSEDQSFYAFPYGYSTDIPAPGDYDGDGKMDAATFRPDIASWYINQSRDGNLYYTFGANGDQPVPGILSR